MTQLFSGTPKTVPAPSFTGVSVELSTATVASGTAAAPPCDFFGFFTGLVTGVAIGVAIGAAGVCGVRTGCVTGAVTGAAAAATGVDAFEAMETTPVPTAFTGVTRKR